MTHWREPPPKADIEDGALIALLAAIALWTVLAAWLTNG